MNNRASRLDNHKNVRAIIERKKDYSRRTMEQKQ